MLRYYPIIVDNLDATSESAMSELLIECAPFAKTSFDYLVVLLRHKSGEINLNALQFPKRMIEKLFNAIETEDNTRLEDLTPPYPVEVTAQMLDCFAEKYIVPMNNSIDTLPIGDIAEALWAYAISMELLSAPEDADYLMDQLRNIRNRVSEGLNALKKTLPKNTFDRLSGDCNSVFDGDKFDNEAFNSFIRVYSQNEAD